MNVANPLPDSEAVGVSDTRLLELYKTAAEMADRAPARRGTANAFYLTVQWKTLQQDVTRPRKMRYVEQGTVERAVPLVFAAIHTLVFVGRVA